MVLDGQPTRAMVVMMIGVLLQATKNKTYTPKNICSGVNKDRSHGEYLA